MPRSPVLWIAAGLLWVLDASINIAMEPFRAFVGDQLSEKQRPAGYRDAELLHRRGRGHRGHAAVDFRACGREQRRHGQRRGGDSRYGALFVRHRRRRAGGRHAVDDLHDARISARRAAWIRRFHAGRRRRHARQHSARDGTRRVVARRRHRWRVARVAFPAARGALHPVRLVRRLGRGAADQSAAAQATGCSRR